MEKVVRELTPEEVLQRKIDDAYIRITNEAKREVTGEWAQWAAGQPDERPIVASGWAGCVRDLGQDRIDKMVADIQQRFKEWKAAEGIE